jgi:hypothetical protein
MAAMAVGVANATSATMVTRSLRFEFLEQNILRTVHPNYQPYSLLKFLYRDRQN